MKGKDRYTEFEIHIEKQRYTKLEINEYRRKEKENIRKEFDFEVIQSRNNGGINNLAVISIKVRINLCGHVG